MSTIEETALGTAAEQKRCAWRGFLLDEARHFFGKEAVKALLDRMVALRLNVFHWHLTDDQGWLMHRLVEQLARRGRRAVAWNEILACGDLPSSTVIQIWQGDAAADATSAARKGHDIILSPVRETYFSIPEGLPNDPYHYRAELEYKVSNRLAVFGEAMRQATTNH